MQYQLQLAVAAALVKRVEVPTNSSTAYSNMLDCM